MSATGIGAPVRRQEDFRFIAGKGQYVDDVNRHGRAHGFILRSPHAYANIKGIDSQATIAMPTTPQAVWRAAQQTVRKMAAE